MQTKNAKKCQSLKDFPLLSYSLIQESPLSWQLQISCHAAQRSGKHF